MGSISGSRTDATDLAELRLLPARASLSISR
jgi:hypothetical protein